MDELRGVFDDVLPHLNERLRLPRFGGRVGYAAMPSPWRWYSSSCSMGLL